MGWLQTFPSTNGRIVLSLLMALGTCIKVLATDWAPPVEWLAFLTVWAGLDVMQFVQKRKTFKGGDSASDQQ